MAAMAQKVGVSRQALAHWQKLDPEGQKPGHAWADAIAWLQNCEYGEFLTVVTWARLPGYLESTLTHPTIKRLVTAEGGSWARQALQLRLRAFQNQKQQYVEENN